MKLKKILIGTNDLKSGGTIITPLTYITHEKYNRPSYANDIGLILVNDMEFNEKVQPIKISKKFIEKGTKLLATGWGKSTVS